MKIRTNTGRSHIKVNTRRDGKDGVVISQRANFVLLSREEWLELRALADDILGITAAPDQRKRHRML